jgi:hypothetical protein
LPPFVCSQRPGQAGSGALRTLATRGRVRRDLHEVLCDRFLVLFVTDIDGEAGGRGYGKREGPVLVWTRVHQRFLEVRHAVVVAVHAPHQLGRRAPNERVGDQVV